MVILIIYFSLHELLFYYQGTIKVQAMDIRGAEACWRGFTFIKKQKRPLWHPNAFLKMSNLKFLRVHNVFPQCVPKHLPKSLRCLDWSHYSANSLPCFQPDELDWSHYSANSLPCFQPDELVQLHLQHSKIEFLWEGMKVRVLIILESYPFKFLCNYPFKFQ